MVVDVIVQEFMKLGLKGQAGKPEAERRAFHVQFHTRIDYEKEEGYRYIDLILWAPGNYVQVWTRDRWVVIPIEDLEDEDDGGPKPGKDYTEGASEWKLIGDHDSGWRGSVEKLCSQRQKDIDSFVGGSWYQLVAPKTLEFLK